MTIALVSASLSLTFLPPFALPDEDDSSVASPPDAARPSASAGTSADAAQEPDKPSTLLGWAPFAMAHAFAEAPLLRAIPTHSFTNRSSADGRTQANVRSGRKICKVTWFAWPTTNRDTSSNVSLTESPPSVISL